MLVWPVARLGAFGLPDRGAVIPRGAYGLATVLAVAAGLFWAVMLSAPPLTEAGTGSQVGRVVGAACVRPAYELWTTCSIHPETIGSIDIGGLTRETIDLPIIGFEAH